ncbi:hypothetical protein G7068_01085 [Leucobacter viscericola]|uniref:Uncharacterized protein n=1 Tax=Leucobacter viscericola TaxID=2714935 RepID=A0A6G7XBM0_9MICO|nr:hypothetical protein [Leucobacter viscericola]QIK61955.1 hypothetical protein G7068_01085 [Leucobacter viscericola]
MTIHNPVSTGTTTVENVPGRTPGRIAWISGAVAGVFSLLATSLGYTRAMLSATGEDLSALGGLGIFSAVLTVVMVLAAIVALTAGIFSAVRSRSRNTGAGIGIGLGAFLLLSMALGAIFSFLLRTVG